MDLEYIVTRLEERVKSFINLMDERNLVIEKSLIEIHREISEETTLLKDKVKDVVDESNARYDYAIERYDKLEERVGTIECKQAEGLGILRTTQWFFAILCGLVVLLIAEWMKVNVF